jgi:DMSO/TMAO reductase YedYZ heme-binding membrane subunit
MIAAVAHYLWAVKQDITLPVLYFVIVAALLGSRVLLRRKASPRPQAVTTPASGASSGQ